ncbi:MAG: ABC transporter permease [Chloroflexota bacterium]|nr:ABC transporter permease [Chloroflexota bacterium]
MSAITERSEARGGISQGRAITYGVLFLAVGLLIFVLFAQNAVPGQTSVFGMTPLGDTPTLFVPDLELPTQTALYVFAAICAFLGGWQLARGIRRANWALGAVAVVFVMAFLTFATRGRSLNLVSLLGSSLLRAVPIALAALSGVLCERSAVINIGIEGMMLMGAFVAALMGSVGRNVLEWPFALSQGLGLLSAILVGALLGLLLAVLSVRFKVDQIISGTAINILATGVTSFFSSRIMAEFRFLNNPGILPPVPVPLLSRIPIIGPVFFQQNLLVYVLYLLLGGIHVMLWHTVWGLRTRAVGEHPRAADTLGIDVFRNRYVNVTVGSMVGALSGAFLILASVGRFDELMTAGKGFIGLAAMIFGNWTPFGAFGAATIFGFADALQTRSGILQVPIPSQFLLMTPYLVTIIVLAGVVGEAIPPAADGEPYEKE